MKTQPPSPARTVARELATVAHARALHAVHPILRLGSPAQRDIVYRTMAEEFRDLESTVERLLAQFARPRGTAQDRRSVTPTPRGADSHPAPADETEVR